MVKWLKTILLCIVIVRNLKPYYYCCHYIFLLNWKHCAPLYLCTEPVETEHSSGCRSPLQASHLQNKWSNVLLKLQQPQQSEKANVLTHIGWCRWTSSRWAPACAHGRCLPGSDPILPLATSGIPAGEEKKGKMKAFHLQQRHIPTWFCFVSTNHRQSHQEGKCSDKTRGTSTCCYRAGLEIRLTNSDNGNCPTLARLRTINVLPFK